MFTPLRRRINRITTPTEGPNNRERRLKCARIKLFIQNPAGFRVNILFSTTEGRRFPNFFFGNFKGLTRQITIFETARAFFVSHDPARLRPLTFVRRSPYVFEHSAM